MAEDILSQEEVDALLRGMSVEAGRPAAEPGGVRPYALGREARIVRARMPGLDLVSERFVRNLREALTALLCREARVTFTPARVVEYDEFLRGLATPANVNLVQVKPLRGTALMVFDRGLVLQAVDSLFGGQGRAAACKPGGELTQMESRIDRRLLQLACDACGAAWQPLHRLEFHYLRSEPSLRFANIAAPAEAVVAIRYTVDLPGGAADFQLCMPYAMLDPVRGQICGDPPAERSGGADGEWASALGAQVFATEVELTAKLATAEITLWQLLSLQVGDVIALDLPEAVVAEVDAVPLLQCRYGVVNGHYALKVERAMGVEPAGH